MNTNKTCLDLQLIHAFNSMLCSSCSLLFCLEITCITCQSWCFQLAHWTNELRFSLAHEQIKFTCHWQSDWVFPSMLSRNLFQVLRVSPCTLGVQLHLWTMLLFSSSRKIVFCNIQFRFHTVHSSSHMIKGVMHPYKLFACLCVFAYSSSSSSLHNMMFYNVSLAWFIGSLLWHGVRSKSKLKWTEANEIKPNQNFSSRPPLWDSKPRRWIGTPPTCRMN